MSQQPSVEPWEHVPSRSLLSLASGRLQSIQASRTEILSSLRSLLEQSKGNCSKEASAPGGAKSVQANHQGQQELQRRLRSVDVEMSRLASWKTVAEFHIGKALGLLTGPEQRDMLKAFESYLNVRRCTIAHTYLDGAEREVILDTESGDNLVLMRLISNNGPQDEQRSIWLCETVLAGNRGKVKQVVKALPKRHGMEEKNARLKKEFIAQNIVGAFRHPNILQLSAYFETDEVMYAVLPCIEACLFDVVADSQQRNGRGLLERNTRFYFVQMVTAVCFLANLGLVHRDLTLENFCIDGRNKIKLIDFGLCHPLELKDADCGEWAKHLGDHHVGKLYYMAPEILYAEQKEIDMIASDIWALGICLYVMIAGQYPFSIANSTEKNFRILAKKGVVALLRAQIKSGVIRDFLVSDDLLDILDKMLTIDPEERITLQGIRTHPFVVNYAA